MTLNANFCEYLSRAMVSFCVEGKIIELDKRGLQYQVYPASVAERFDDPPAVSQDSRPPPETASPITPTAASTSLSSSPPPSPDSFPPSAQTSSSSSSLSSFSSSLPSRRSLHTRRGIDDYITARRALADEMDEVNAEWWYIQRLLDGRLCRPSPASSYRVRWFERKIKDPETPNPFDTEELYARWGYGAEEGEEDDDDVAWEGQEDEEDTLDGEAEGKKKLTAEDEVFGRELKGDR
ncbi:hypothetical protein JCM8547_002931 [Rhodosporidiobolus lusitaniae]